jgi:hypothetical protein
MKARKTHVLAVVAAAAVAATCTATAGAATPQPPYNPALFKNCGKPNFGRGKWTIVTSNLPCTVAKKLVSILEDEAVPADGGPYDHLWYQKKYPLTCIGTTAGQLPQYLACAGPSSRSLRAFLRL